MGGPNFQPPAKFALSLSAAHPRRPDGTISADVTDLCGRRADVLKGQVADQNLAAVGAERQRSQSSADGNACDRGVSASVDRGYSVLRSDGAADAMPTIGLESHLVHVYNALQTLPGHQMRSRMSNH